MLQLLAHLWGDYLLQSDWMAVGKRKSSWPCTVHAELYTLCFFPVICMGYHSHPGWLAFAIFQTHWFIDRFGLARYVVWAKNMLALLVMGAPAQPGYMDGELEFTCRGNLPWSDCQATGYDPSRPVWLATWLLIIADNTLHLTCNYLLLRLL